MPSTCPVPSGTPRTGWSSGRSSVPRSAGPGFSLGDAPAVVDEDDETLEEASRSLDANDAILCAVCGALHAAGTKTCPGVACGGALLWPVRRLSTAQDTVSGCLACGARGAAMVRQFETGGDAAASVITTALYQALPARR